MFSCKLKFLYNHEKIIYMNPKQIIRALIRKRTKVEKLAERIGVAPLALPVFLRDENTAKLILKAEKHMNVDDPAILIQWNANGFNDTAVKNCRNGVPGQTQAAIVNYIVGNGGVNFNGLNTLFLFRNNLAITNCQYQFPSWTHHQAGVADVCLSVCRINKPSDAGRIDYELFDYPLMV